ncbi:MAG TPA: CHASE domain-containing protein [Azospira sp.]|nr:CHASE domain-containing protein [Azospira sp.]
MLTWRDLTQRHERNLQDHFSLETERLTTKIDERMAAYAQILRAGAGLFAASEQVSRQEWRRFYEQLDLQQTYQGIQGVGFTAYIPREQLARHVQAVRQEGFPDYQVRPEGDRPEYSSIVYLEPFSGGNLRAFGYDMWSEPVRHGAMALARDSGRVAFSGKVRLVQEGKTAAQAGFLAYHPVYRNGSSPQTVEERRAALVGWVYSPYRADDLLNPILQNDLGPIRIEIFDGDTTEPEALLYDSGRSPQGSAEEPASSPASVFSLKSRLDLEGRRWTLRYTALPEFVSTTKFEPPWVEMAAIGVIGLLLLGVTWGFLNTQRHAERIARQLVERLRENETKLQRMLEDLPLGLCLVEDSGLIAFRNRRFLDLFGYDVQEVPTLAEWWQAAYPDPDYRQEVLSAWNTAVARAAESGTDIEPMEYRVTAKNGQVRDILISGITLGPSFLATFADLTERNEHERQLKQARTEAEAASQAKSAFVANMSHEIRTPMNAVLGLLQLLQYTSLSERQLDYTQKAKAAAQSLLLILNDILDFSKVEAGKLTLECTTFRLDELLRNLSVVLSAALQDKEVEVLFRLDPATPRTLRGDALRLQQVLLNLAGNAIKFTERGEVVVALRLLQISPNSARIEFSVRDTGIGIPADRLSAIFEGFTQAETSTTRRYGGTGLGLAISQRLVRLMGGELVVESTEGKGSRFSFTLDFARDEESLEGERESAKERDKEKATQGRPEAAPLPHALHVLIVDDNATAREILAGMTKSFGWQTETAASGAEALALMQREAAAGKPFDVVCVDWVMPGMDGWETIQHMRATPQGEKEPAILMVTAHGRELLTERLTEGQSDGQKRLDGFLVKPVTPSMLFDAVAHVTGGRSVTSDRRSAARPSDSDRLAGLRILVVEDTPLNQQVAQELLTHAGAYVQVANDGRQGINSIQSARLPFDVVLMDIQMPEMDGYEATRILRQEMGATLPIIAMTANALPSDRAACLAAGMNDHVGKPIDISELVSTILRHCRQEDLGDSSTRGPLLTSPPALPPLPAGFDLASALARLDHNRPLFAKLVRQFAQDQGALLSRAFQSLRQGDRDLAGRELHTLKGVAATLGAQALAHTIAETEARLKAGTGAAEDDQLFERLRQQLAEAVQCLGTVAETFEPEAEAGSQSPPDQAQVIDYLEELATLLAANNMRALDVHATLKREAGGMLGEHLAALDEAIGKLDFLAAGEKTANLIALLKS